MQQAWLVTRLCRKMRSQLVFVTFMTFVSIAYYLMASGQSTVARDLTPQPLETAAVNDSAAAGNDSAPVGRSPYPINHPRLCPAEAIAVLIMVVTAPNNSDVRTAIRRTWGTVGQRSDVRLAFVLGRPPQAEVQERLVQEDRLYGDLLQGDFLDAYYNLTLKSVMILRWAQAHCPLAEHVLKIDDDCFLNPHTLLKYVQGLKASDSTIHGKVWKKVKPIRDKKDKWAVLEDVYPDKEFPDYTGGPSYVISRAAVPLLLKAATDLRALDLEDVYVTGICAEKAKVPRTNDNRFNVADPPLVCASRDVITYHRVSPDVLYMLWWAVNDDKFATCASKDKGCDKSRHQLLVDITNLVLKNLHN